MDSFEEPSSIGIGNIRKDDNKWYGVPPKGEQPIPGKWLYVLRILGVIVLEILIWGVYRWFTAPIFVNFGTLQFYLIHIIAAPTIHLIPILIYWQFVRGEKGLPFVFTKKLLMSGVIVGFCGAIIWRVLEEITYDTVAGMAGGTVPGTFTLFNLMDSSTILLFSIMTFVHFFIVGPVEELEFRGFAQDQTARVLPNWQALILSSVLFGCSHIPIAVFVYRFPPAEFIVALIGWISAGAVFGVLYMWSRNILACIVMHGMGNWQLSVFYFASTELTGGMDSLTMVVVGTLASLIADVIIILIFYVIHLYYWQPHRRGEPAFGGILLSLQNFVHNHDFDRKPITTTAACLVAFCVVVSGMIIGVTYAFGERDLSKFSSELEDTDELNMDYLNSLVENTEMDAGSGLLAEGDSIEITFNSTKDRFIKNVMVTVTWTDEDDIQYVRTYENDPDIFSVEIDGPNASVEESGANPHGAEGSVTCELTYTIEELSEIINTVGEDYGIVIEITLVEAGDYWSTSGAWGFVDDENQYEYEIEIVWLEPE